MISAEVPVPAIRAALARAHGTLCVLNLAPVPGTQEQAAAIVADGVEWLVVNESEAGAVLGRPVEGLKDAAQAAADLHQTSAVVRDHRVGAALADAGDLVGEEGLAPRRPLPE